MVVQTSTFGTEFTVLNKSVKDSFMLWYDLRSMGIKISKTTHIFVENMNVVFNATNPGITLNKKTGAFSYHFCR